MKEKKQKKHNYKFILGIIVGGVIFGLLGVYAATQIASSNVTYTNNSQSTVSGALDNLFNKTKLQVGSYLYMTPSTSSYSIAAADTGYDSAQTIKPSELNRWIIISKNSDGTYDAVSQYVSSVGVNFSGRTGYQNYVGTLNTIANQYQNSTYTTKARHMGYVDQTLKITDLSIIDNSTVQWKYNTYSYPDYSNEPKGFGDVLYINDYQLVKKAVGTTIAYKVNATTTVATYWMASRNYTFTDTSYWYYGGRLVGEGGEVSLFHMYAHYGSQAFISGTGNFYVRPIITLKSGIKVTGGLGTSSSPYTISV